MTTALDLFRGAGGWSVACKRLGIEDYGVENMPEANATAEAAGYKSFVSDVWDPPGSIVDAIFEGLIASPPCQTFSTAGKGKGRDALDSVLGAIDSKAYFSLDSLRQVGEQVGDERTALVLTPLHYAVQLEPEWICWEQVPTVLPVWERCAKELRQEGYNVWTGNLQAEQYGVPQTRKRAILIASRKRQVGMPVPTHSRYYSRSPQKLDPGVQKWVSMAEALGWSDTGAMRSNYGTGGNPALRGERALSDPAPTITSKVGRNKWLPKWCHNRPSTTIVGSFKPEIVAAPGYRTTVSRQNAPDSVRVSVAEAGILQSFPADYPWQGSKTKQYLQVGNAIPTRMAEAVIREAAGITG